MDPDQGRVVVTAALGRWATNCHVIADRAAGEAVVVDPGETGATYVPALLDELGVRAHALLLTHGHLDHLWAVPDLARSLDVPVLLHADDLWLWRDPGAAFGAGGVQLLAEVGLVWDPPGDVVDEVRDGQRLTFAGTDIDVRHNPGHTPGHVTYLARLGSEVPVLTAQVPGGPYEDAQARAAGDGILLSGDLLFRGSIGRTDLVGGSNEQMAVSLAKTVLPLDDDTLVLAGHGPSTSVGHERRTNPYLTELAART